MSVLKANGETITVSHQNLPYATPEHKGCFKQADSVVCFPVENSVECDFEHVFNNMIRAFRRSGYLQNAKYALIIDLNHPDAWFDKNYELQQYKEFDHGDQFTIDFSDGEETVPEASYDSENSIFLGYGTSPDQETPTYPYDPQDPSSFTVTFDDDDIVLYAIWGARNYNHNVTYHLGDGTTVVEEADEREDYHVRFDFEFAPDDDGRSFVGWSTTHEYDDQHLTGYNNAEYRDEGGYEYMYDVRYDVDLYPVYAFQCTISFDPGNGTGTVPSSITDWEGKTVSINSAIPSLTCNDASKTFIGWSKTQNAQMAEYPYYNYGGGMQFINGMITLSNSFTLYAVYGEGSSGGITPPSPQVNTLTYSSDGKYYSGSAPSMQMGTSYPGSNGAMQMYNISYNPHPSCTKEGNWKFVGWSFTPDDSSPDYIDGIHTSTGGVSTGALTLYPVFINEDDLGENTLVVNATNSSAPIIVYKDNDGSLEYHSHVAAYDKQGSVPFDNKSSYVIKIYGEFSSASAVFTGTYSEGSYENGVQLPIEDSKKSENYGKIGTPNSGGDTHYSWLFASGDSGSISISVQSNNQQSQGDDPVDNNDQQSYGTLHIQAGSSDINIYREISEGNYDIDETVSKGGTLDYTPDGKFMLELCSGTSEGESIVYASSSLNKSLFTYSNGSSCDWKDPRIAKPTAGSVDKDVFSKYEWDLHDGEDHYLTVTTDYLVVNNPDESGTDDVILVDHTDNDNFLGTIDAGEEKTLAINTGHEYYIVRRDGAFGAYFTGTYDGQEFNGDSTEIVYDTITIDGNEYYYIQTDDGAAAWTFTGASEIEIYSV